MTISLFGSIVFLNAASLVSGSPAPLDVEVHFPATQSRRDLVHAISQEFTKVSARDRDWKNSTTFDRSWDGAVLLQLDKEADTSPSAASTLSVNTGIEVVCTSCYLRGVATAELTVASTVNISQELTQLEDNLVDTVENFTEAAYDYVKDFFDEAKDSMMDHGDVALPTFDFDFNNVSIAPVPQANLRFSFDGLELYMLVDTTLSVDATYTLNLFNSGRDLAGTPAAVIGIYITENLHLGLIFTVDLILAAHADIDVSSGFHLLLDDGFAIDIALFGHDVSSVTHNGGHFEFLPVQVESAGAVFNATLRVGAYAGIALGKTIDLSDKDYSVSGGIEVGVYANVAEFTTNITAQPDSADCELGLEQYYQFALGATAGATVAFDTNTWGPVATKLVPIFTTELASACITKGRTSATSDPTAFPTTRNAEKRQDLSTATISTTATYTGVNCISAGLVNCPASLQSTTISSTTSTTTTLVPSDIDDDKLTWPSAVYSTVTSTATFNKKAMSLPSTSGSPVPYTAPPPASTSKTPIGGVVDKIEHGVDGIAKPVFVGVTVGLGVALLLALVVIVFLLLKPRTTYSSVEKEEQ